MESTPLQVTIGGMGRDSKGATTMLGEFDHDTGVLLIGAERQEVPGVPIRRDPDSVVATNLPRGIDYDVLFDEDDMREAIVAFFDLHQGGLLVLDNQAHLPSSHIELDGVDEHGRKYRVNENIKNGQVAVIVMCWLASKQAEASNHLDAFADLPDLQAMTVGLPAEFTRAAQQAMGMNVGNMLPVSDDGYWMGG